MFFTKVCIWLYSGIISTGVFPLEEEILLCPVWKLERAGWCFWGCVEKKSWMRLAYGCLSQSWLSPAILNEPYHKPGFPALRLSWWPKEGWKLDSPELQSRSLPTAWRIYCPCASLEPGTIIPLPAFHLHKISFCWSWVSLYRMGKGLRVLLWWRCFHSCTEWRSLPKRCLKGTRPAVSWGLSRWSRPVLWLFLKGFWKQPYFARLGWEG